MFCVSGSGIREQVFIEGCSRKRDDGWGSFLRGTKDHPAHLGKGGSRVREMGWYWNLVLTAVSNKGMGSNRSDVQVRTPEECLTGRR